MEKTRRFSIWYFVVAFLVIDRGAQLLLQEETRNGDKRNTPHESLPAAAGGPV